jgi:4-amino-4-deoxy-L-arabinose transferase-like glycosyltransferase
MVLGNTITLLVAYLYARKLIGFLPALTGFLLIAFEPFNLALTRLLHLDGLLSSLFLLSLLAFVYFLESRRWRDLIVSGVAAGLCWLTKSPAFFLGLAIGLIALIQAWRSYRVGTQPLKWKHLWKYLWPLLVWGLTGMSAFVIFWPAMWVDPIGSLSSVLQTATAAAQSGHASGIYFRGTVSVERGLSFAYFYPLTYLWRTTPVVLLGLLVAVWGLITHREPFDRPAARTTVLGFVIAVVVFTLGMTLGAKKIGRYMLPVYGPLTLIAGMGWVSLAYWIRDRKNPFLSKYSFALVLIPVVGLQMYSSLRTYPYYFPYYNPLMGGSRVAPDVLQIGWGEGLDQAADYLNQQPEAEELEVLSWYAKGGFSYFFDGQTLDMGYDPDLSDSERKKMSRADYILVYINQLQKNRPAELLEALADRDPVKIIEINGIEYVRIYKMK